jgi:type VI secretion system protein ImpB
MSSQKFIARNRAPRVQIEYDVEAYGAEKRVQLPFVVGVLADLTGNAGKPQEPVKDRKLTEISADDFDRRLEGLAPGVCVTVPNTLTGEGNLKAEMTFKAMDDFSPAAVARSVPALRQLLEAREQLANLITYMDGKEGAEQLIARLLKDPDALRALGSSAKPSSNAAAPSNDEGEK